MDVLYILGKGSFDGNNELRYSLRSLERYVKGVDRVVLVGEDPRFISDKVEYYYCKEFEGNKEYRIAKKIEWACKNVMSGDFLFMNDDFFFTKSIDPETYPYYHKGSLLSPAPNKQYMKALNDTGQYLERLGKTSFHFDVHCPIIYNSNAFLKLDPHIKASQMSQYGFVVKSLYSNILGIKGEFYEDVKLWSLNTPKDFERINKTSCFSCSDAGWQNGVRNYLKKEYPNKSKYEQV